MTDRIKKGEVKVAFCPTYNMLADFFQRLWKEACSHA